MSKRTPGEWSRELDSDANWQCYCVIHSGTHQHIAGRIGNEADAVAIASVPELIALAEWLDAAGKRNGGIQVDDLHIAINEARIILGKINGGAV